MPAPIKFMVSRRDGRRSIRVLAIVAVLLSASLPASAQQALTTDQAVAKAKQQVPGKLVAITREQQGDQEVYRVRILGADGVVRTVFVNANP